MGNPPTEMTIELQNMVNSAVQQAINTAIPQVAEVFKIELAEQLTELQRQNEQRFISREEFEALVNRFNELPPKPADAADLEAAHRRMDTLSAENTFLKEQYDKVYGGQTELRDSIRDMRQTAEAIQNQSADMKSTSNVLMGVLESYKDVLQGVHREQEVARTDREAANKRLDAQLVENTRIENRIIDTEARLIQFAASISNIVLGGGGLPGINKMFETVQASIEEFRTQYQKDREADQPILERARTGQRIQSAFLSFIWKVVWTKEFGAALIAGGSIGAAILAIFGGK